MKTTAILVGAIVSLAWNTGAHADVIVGVSTTAHNDKANPWNWTISDLNNATPTVSTATPLPNTTPTISGDVTGAGTFGSSESLVFNLFATTSWNSFTPDAATFDTQIAGIRGDTDVNMFNQGIAIGNAALDGTAEALILQIDTDNVTGEVTLVDVGLTLTGGQDVANYIVWDSDSSTFLANETARSSTISHGPHILNTGDIVVLGVDDTNTGNYRVTGFEFDVGASTATAVPEPSSFLTTSAAFLAFGCFVRRRRKVASDIAGSD